MRNASPSLVLVVLAAALTGACGWPGARVSSQEVDFGVGDVRIVEREEAGPVFLAGVFYVVAARTSETSRWRKVMTFRHDDQGGIPDGAVTVVSDQTAFVILGWMYAVTTDGGQHWTVWDAKDDLVGWQCCNYALIEHVALNSDGTGAMRLSVIDPGRGEVPMLVTTDFGRTWTRPVSNPALQPTPQGRRG